jgi:hypothetical protein
VCVSGKIQATGRNLPTGTPLAAPAAHVMANEVSRQRTLIEWLLSAAALTTVIVVMLMVESPVRQNVMTTATKVSHDVVALRLPQPVERVGRTAWRICMDHQPLAAFAGIAVVLVFFMRRMR